MSHESANGHGYTKLTVRRIPESESETSALETGRSDPDLDARPIEVDRVATNIPPYQANPLCTLGPNVTIPWV